MCIRDSNRYQQERLTEQRMNGNSGGGGSNKTTSWDLNFNPTKLLSSIVNALNSGRLAAQGTVRILTGTGVTVGSLGTASSVSVPTAAVGVWNLKSSYHAYEASMQQWGEAMNEPWGNANMRNFIGVLPYGTNADDLGEPSYFEVLQNKATNFMQEPLEALGELGKLL